MGSNSDPTNSIFSCHNMVTTENSDYEKKSYQHKIDLIFIGHFQETIWVLIFKRLLQ